MFTLPIGVQNLSACRVGDNSRCNGKHRLLRLLAPPNPRPPLLWSRPDNQPRAAAVAAAVVSDGSGRSGPERTATSSIGCKRKKRRTPSSKPMRAVRKRTRTTTAKNDEHGWVLREQQPSLMILGVQRASCFVSEV